MAKAVRNKKERKRQEKGKAFKGSYVNSTHGWKYRM